MGTDFLPGYDDAYDQFSGENWQDPLGQIDYARKRQQEKFQNQPIEQGDWISFLGHFADELENNPDLKNPIGIPKKGLDYLGGLATGDTKVDLGGNIQSKSLGSIVAPPLVKGWQRALNFGVEPEENIGTKALTGLAKGGIDLATDPSMPLISNPAVGAAMLTPMVKDVPEQAGNIWSLIDQGKYNEAAEAAGEFIPGAAMLAHGLKTHVPEIAKGAASFVPEVNFGNGYSSRSPLTFNLLDPRGNREVPNFASAMAEGGGVPKENFVGSIVEPQLETLTRPRPLYRTVAEHGTPEGTWLDQGRNLQPSETGRLGQGGYLSQETDNAPRYAKMYEDSNNPRVAKGDVSAEKPLFLEEPAPQDLRMKAMLELNKFKQSGAEGYSPEDLAGVKHIILSPETTAQELSDSMSHILNKNIPVEQRATYTGDPLSDFYKSAGYDLWQTGRKGSPAQEIVVTDPRRQFKIGEVYDPRKGSREVLADTSGVPVPKPELVEDPNNPFGPLVDPRTLGKGKKTLPNASDEPLLSDEAIKGYDTFDAIKDIEAPTGPKPINVPTIIDKAARALGYKDNPLSVSRIQEEGKGTPDPIKTFETSQEHKYGSDWKEKQPDAEKDYYKRLLERSGSATFTPLTEGQKGKAIENPEEVQPPAEEVLRKFTRKDGTQVTHTLVDGDLIKVEKHDKDGNLISATIGSSLDDQLPIENQTKPVGKVEPPVETPNTVPLSASERTKAGLEPDPVVQNILNQLKSTGGEKPNTPPIATAKKPTEVDRVIDSLNTKIVKETDRQEFQAAMDEAKKTGNTARLIDTIERAQGREEAQKVAAQIRQARLQDKQTVDLANKVEKAQNAEEVQKQTNEARQREQAQTKELQDQLRVERQKALAGDKEARARADAIERELKDKLKVEQAAQRAKEGQSWEVTLDDGTKVRVKAPSASAAMAKVEDSAKRLGSERTVAGVLKAKTPLEKALTTPAKTAKIPKSSILDSPPIKLLNSFKSLAFGGDIGHLFRQGKQLNADLLFSKNAGQVLKQFSVLAKSFSPTKGEQFFNDFHAKLNADPTIKMLTDKFGLDMPGVGKGHLKEEIFHGEGFAEKLPGLGKYYAKPSERAYTAGLNFLRAAVAKARVENLQKAGFTPENAPEKYRGVARAINIISQRGDFQPGAKVFTPHMAKILSDSSAIFGAPRAKAGRIQNLAELAFGSGESGKIVRTTFAKTVGMNIAMYGLIKLAYPTAQFITDRDRTDFGKIKIGNTTWDPWMGLGTTVRTAMRMSSGKTTSPYSGRSYSPAPVDAPTKEVAGMLAPGIRAAWTLMMGNDPGSWAIGKPPGGYLVDRKDALSQVLPMSPKQAYEILQEQGPEGFLLSAMQLAGEGVDVYNPTKAKAEQARLKQERGIKVSNGRKALPRI